MSRGSTGSARNSNGSPRSKARSVGGGRSRASEPGAGSGAASLADLIHTMSRHLNELTLEDLRRFGMTVPRWSVLTQLAVRDGRSVGDLSRATVIKQSSLTRVVDQMERDGLVRRHAAQEDNRVVEVWLTGKGRKTYEEVVPLAVHRLHEAMAGLRETDLQQIKAGLEGLLDEVRKARS